MPLRLLAIGAASPGFELAARRSLFSLILLTTYLLGGALVFTVLSYEATGGGEGGGADTAHLERLDFARAELLSIIWAEAIGLAERDWSVLANQKMDTYEQILLRTYRSTGGAAFEYGRERRGYWAWFRHSLLLATTIGGVSIAELSPPAKLVSILYSLVGIPLTLIYIGHCAKALQALLQIDGGDGRRKGVSKRILLTALFVLVVTAVVLDCVEGNDDGDLPFLDALTTLFLAFASIGATERDAEIIPTWLLYLSSIVSLAVFSLTFVQIQSTLEGWMGGYEWSFTQQVGKLERVLSIDRLSNVLEETEESASGDGDTDRQRRDGDISVEHLFTLNSTLSDVVEDRDEDKSQ